MAGITKAVSTKSRNEIFYVRVLDSDFAKLPVGQISSVSVRRPNRDLTRSHQAHPILAVGPQRTLSFCRLMSAFKAGTGRAPLITVASLKGRFKDASPRNWNFTPDPNASS
jgi:hypothetical protein